MTQFGWSVKDTDGMRCEEERRSVAAHAPRHRPFDEIFELSSERCVSLFRELHCESCVLGRVCATQPDVRPQEVHPDISWRVIQICRECEVSVGVLGANGRTQRGQETSENYTIPWSEHG